MTYKILFHPSAARDLRKLPSDLQARILARAEALASEPRPPGVKKLAGLDELYRIRVGDYRLIYQIQDQCLVVLVIRIRHRRDVYRP